MYLAYWGMTRPPFEEGLSPTGAIMSSGTKLSLTKIRWALHSGWQVTVSYTHLTLPTIYSV